MKYTLGILVTTTLDGPVVVFTCIEGLTTLVLKEIGVNKVNFIDTTGAVGMFDNGTLTCGEDTPPANMDEVWV